MLSPVGWEDWEALSGTKLWPKLVEEGHVVATEPAGVDAAPQLLAGETAGVLRHERVPFISYAYEWPFSMLQDAALLQLELNQRALKAGLALKDATPYNIQFRGTRPVFIDVGSFEKLRPGEPWIGYRQFCMQFLYPLMFQAYKDLPYHPLLRGVARRHLPRRGARRVRRRPLQEGRACPTCCCTRRWSRATPTPAAARSSSR